MLGAEFRTREVRDEEDEMVGSLAYGFSGGSRPIVGFRGLPIAWLCVGF